MAYKSSHWLFRDLTDEEEAEFRKHARENDPPHGVDWEVLHPVCREEWEKRGITPWLARMRDAINELEGAGGGT